MQALNLLRADHRHLQSLFEEVRQTADFHERRSLFEQIRDALELHADLEERAFYPAFRRNSAWIEILEEALEDHRLMDEMIAELSSMTDTEDFSDGLDELVESIEDHLLEEENEIFPALLPVLTESDWELLARAMEAYRSEGAETGRAA